MVVEINSFFYAGRKSLGLVLASRLTWFVCRWSILSSFQFGGSNLTWFQSRDRIFLCVSLFRK